MVPCWALSATGEVSWVLTTMPSATVAVQEATGLRWPSTSTRHCRQAPIGSSSGWSQKRGICTPSCSAARMISVPFGTLSSNPSTVTVTSSSSGWAGRSGASVMSVRSRELGRPQPGRDAAGDVVLELRPEVLQGGGDRAGRAVAERAERPAEDVVAGVQQGVQVLGGALAGQDPAQHLDHPVRPLTAGRALAAGLVRVEGRPLVDRVDHAVGVV